MAEYPQQPILALRIGNGAEPPSSVRSFVGQIVRADVAVGYRSSFSCELRFDPQDADGITQMESVRPMDCVRFTASRGDQRLVTFLGFVTQVTRADQALQNGAITWTYRLDARGYGEVLDETTFYLPTGMVDGRHPGILPYVEWQEGLPQRFVQTVRDGDLSGFVRGILQELLEGLYPVDQTPLLALMSFGRIAPVRGLSYDAGNIAGPGFTLSELLSRVISPDLHEFFWDYDGERPAPVFRAHPLVRRRPREVTELPLDVIRAMQIARPAVDRPTAWAPAGLASFIYSSNLMTTLGMGSLMPVVETPLLNRYGFHMRQNQDPLFASAGTKAGIADLFAAALRRMLESREAHWYDAERPSGAVTLKAAQPVQPGNWYRVRLSRPVQFRAQDTSEYRKGRERYTFMRTDAMLVYATSVRQAFSVLPDGKVISETRIEYQHGSPDAALPVPSVPKVVVTTQPTSVRWKPVNGIVLAGTRYPAPFAVIYELNRDAVPGFTGFHARTTTITHPLQGIVVHHSAAASADTTLDALIGRNVSTHFIVGLDGAIYQLLDPVYYVAHHAGHYNPRSIGIDLVGGPAEADGPGVEFTAVQREALIVLINYLITQPATEMNDVEGIRMVIPYYRNGIPTQQWRKFAGLAGFPILQVPGVYAHNQLADDRWDPCLPKTTFETRGHWWEEFAKMLKQSWGQT